MKCIIICVLSFFLVNHGTTAYPNGAGSCNTGVAVGDSHLINPIKGSLKDGNFQVATNGNVVLKPNLNVTAISPGQGYQLNVLPILNSGAVFRGVLIRVEGPGNFTISPRLNAQVATACSGDGVLGVTHIDSTDKTEFGAGFKTASEGLYKIEVTVVVANSQTSGSIFYYDSYEFTSFEDVPDFPTITPEYSNVTVSPVAASVPVATAPVAVPVPTPALSPVTVDTTATNIPVAMNVTSPTSTTSAPSITMSPSTTKTPSDANTIQPDSDVPTGGMTTATTLRPTKGDDDDDDDERATSAAPMIGSVPTPVIAPMAQASLPTPTTSSGRGNIGCWTQALYTALGAALIVGLPNV